MGLKDGDRLQLRAGGLVFADRVIYCVSRGSRREGLLALDRLELPEGILMEIPDRRKGKAGLATSIHMIGMRFPIAVAWLDGGGRVVHSTIARPWGLYYASSSPAWHVLEVHPQHIGRLDVGTVLQWDEVS